MEPPTRPVSAAGSHGGQPQHAANRYLVQSVGRALDAITFVADGPPEGRSVAELSKMLGLAKSSALAIARTLVAHGYLRTVEPGPRYRLGMSLIHLGDLTARQVPVAEVCSPVLTEITEETGLTARAAVADEGFPLFVARVDGPGTVRFHTPLGRREPAHATAAGKAILSTLTKSQVRAIARKHGLPAHTPHTITDIDTLLGQLAQIRRQGYAIDDGEDVRGVTCVGAAFFSHSGTCAGALSITGLTAELPAPKVAKLGEVMRGYADQVSAVLGGRPYAELPLTDR